MVFDLLWYLCFRSKVKRRTIAMKLAKRGDDESIVELFRMVEGSRKKGRKFGRKYDYDYQLFGIEALAETKRLDVLNHLKWLYAPRSEEVTKYVDFDQLRGGEVVLVRVGCKTEEVRFPNARGELRFMLDYTLDKEHLSQRNMGSEIERSDIPLEQIEAKRKSIISEQPFYTNPHCAIRKTIQKLEECLIKAK